MYFVVRVSFVYLCVRIKLCSFAIPFHFISPSSYHQVRDPAREAEAQAACGPLSMDFEDLAQVSCNAEAILELIALKIDICISSHRLRTFLLLSFS